MDIQRADDLFRKLEGTPITDNSSKQEWAERIIQKIDALHND